MDNRYFYYKKNGDVYYEQNKWQQALDNYKEALKYVKEPSVLFNLAYCADKLKDFDTAIKFYSKCAEIEPESYAYNNIAYIFQRKKNYEEAEKYYRLALQHGDDKKLPARNLFKLFYKLKQIDKLKEIINQYPSYFTWKEYREKLLKLNINLSSSEDIEELLSTKTTNEHAGTIKVVQENLNFDLYPHQKDAIKKLNKWNKKNKTGSGLLVLPTGGGKTKTAAYWIMQDILSKGGKVLWIAHRYALLDQAFNGFKSVCYQDVISNGKQSYNYRIISGQHNKPVHIKPDDDILIAGRSSLARNLNYIQDWIAQNKDKICFVIDEAHHSPASEYIKLINSLKDYGGNFHILGLTATPFRTSEDEQGLLKKLFYDDILYKIDLHTLIERGFLAEPIFHQFDTNINMTDLFNNGGAEEVLERIINDKKFDISSLDEKSAKLIAEHSERNQFIVNTYVKNRNTYGKTLVFALNIDMAIALNKLFNDSGVRSKFVVSGIRDKRINISAKDNDEAIQQFRAGELDVLVNVNILTEGTDLPEVQSIFLTRPTKSKILMTQMIGRALRGEKAGGTAQAYIVVFIDDWNERIAWTNPEKLFIDENADFKDAEEARRYAIRLVSIAKIEEFAKLANDTLDERVTNEFSFFERIPVGFYQINYLPEDEEETQNCTILVYDCMVDSYNNLMEWLKTQEPENLSKLDKIVDRIDKTLFSEREKLLGYNKQDIYDILKSYRQIQTLPQWVKLEERAEYDISELAKHIIDNRFSRFEEDEYINSEWERADGKWKSFLGYKNINAFNAAIDQEIRRTLHPERHQPSKIQPITQQEEIQIKNLSLAQIYEHFPEIYEKVRDYVFKKYRDEAGYYFSAKSGYKNKNKLMFQIDHIKPLAKGGLTTLDNLQLLTAKENIIKNDK